MSALSLITIISLTTGKNYKGSRLLLSSNTCPDNSFCSGKSDGNYANPEGYSQNHFISCVEGQYLFCSQCPANSIYDATLDRCEYDDSAEVSIPQPPGPTGPDDKCPSNRYCRGKSDGNYQNPDWAPQNYFYRCIDGYIYCVECPAGLIYDSSTNKCQYDDDDTPIPPPRVTGPNTCPDHSFCGGKTDGYYQNPVHFAQDKYSKCVGGYLMECIECPLDLVYDPTEDECVECLANLVYNPYRYRCCPSASNYIC